MVLEFVSLESLLAASCLRYGSQEKRRTKATSRSTSRSTSV